MASWSSDCDESTLVAALLGRPPMLPWRVADRCPDGTPRVLEVPPAWCEAGQWRPFPTILWLVCPRLRQEVATMESDGWIRRLSARLRDEPGLAGEFAAGQVWFGAWRHARVSTWPGLEPPAAIMATVDRVNVAGCRDRIGVKCLHAHVAQALVVGHNPLGAAVLAATSGCVGEPSCRTWLSARAAVGPVRAIPHGTGPEPAALARPERASNPTDTTSEVPHCRHGLSQERRAGARQDGAQAPARRRETPVSRSATGPSRPGRKPGGRA